MAQFLRDQFQKNLTVSAETISQLFAVFDQRATALNGRLNGDEESRQWVLRHNVIRFDNKGYRVFDLPELISYYALAESVERIVITAESRESLATNRVVGSFFELRLDVDPKACMLHISSDEKDWVDASFFAASEVLGRAKNSNHLVRNNWTPFFVQIAGVSLGFVASLWVAAKVSPFIALENGLLITFLFSLLLFSNLWTPVNNQIGRLVHKAFPSIYFSRPDKSKAHWLAQAVIGGAVFAVAAYGLGQAQDFIMHFMQNAVLKK